MTVLFLLTAAFALSKGERENHRPAVGESGVLGILASRASLLYPHEPGSSGRQSAPSELGQKSEPTDVGCYGSGVQSANLDSANSLPEGRVSSGGERVIAFVNPVTSPSLAFAFPTITP